MIVFPRDIAIAVKRKSGLLKVCYQFNTFRRFFLLLRVALVKVV
jgi:hypothetical protein